MVLKDTASCATAGSLNMDGGWVRRPSDDPENKTKQTNQKKSNLRCYIKSKSQLYFEHLFWYSLVTLHPHLNEASFV